MVILFSLFSILKAQEKITHLDGLCAAVSTAEEEEVNHKNIYVYQTIIEKYAKVNDQDNGEEIKRKIQIFWKEYSDILFCDALDFNVPKGSIIKLAVARRFENFIDDVTETWNVDLNKIDRSDNMTVLDYVRKELEMRNGTPHEPVLKRYYKKFRSYGAKHKDELVEVTQTVSSDSFFYQKIHQ